MQITIYLPDDLIRRIDALAKKHGKSRSSLIQTALNAGLEAEKAVAFPEETLSVFGSWKELSVEEMKGLRKSFAKDARRLKLR
jgi:metal-responsive CopG/Arc/MetJ family transcriptional regulator